MSKITGLDFETVENSYDNNLNRVDTDILNVADNKNIDFGGSKLIDTPWSPEGSKKILGNDLDNLWISSYIKSRGYKPKISGFKLDGKTGEIECTGLDVWGGTITGAIFQTGESGPRVVIDGTNFIQTYDSNYLRVKIDTTSLKFYEGIGGSLGASLYGETIGGAHGFNADADYFTISSSDNENAVLYISTPNYLGTIAMAETGALAGRLLIQGDAASPYISIYGHLIPESDGDLWSLGIPTVRWKDIFISGDISMEAGKTVDGVDISAHVSNANAHHSSTSNGIAITPSSVTLTNHITFNTASNVGLYWDTSGENAKLYFDNTSSNCFVFTHSLFVGESAGYSIRFGNDTWISGNASDISFNQTLEPNANGTLDLGGTGYFWRNLYLSDDIYLDTDKFIRRDGSAMMKFETGFIRTQGNLAPFQGNVDNLGDSGVKYKNLYLDQNIFLDTGQYIYWGAHWLKHSEDFTFSDSIQPQSGNNYYCGNATNYWKYVYSYYFKYGVAPSSFDKYDDLQILRDLKTSGNNIDMNNMPKEIYDKDGFTNLGNLEGFSLCASKKIVECIDDLKKTIENLTKRINKLEKI